MLIVFKDDLETLPVGVYIRIGREPTAGGELKSIKRIRLELGSILRDIWRMCSS